MHRAEASAWRLCAAKPVVRSPLILFQPGWLLEESGSLSWSVSCVVRQEREAEEIPLAKLSWGALDGCTLQSQPRSGGSKPVRHRGGISSRRFAVCLSASPRLQGEAGQLPESEGRGHANNVWWSGH